MYYLLMPGANAGTFTQMYLAEDEDQLDFIIERLQPVPGTYAVVDNLDGLPAGWEEFPGGVTFTISPPVATYSIALARVQAKRTVGARYTDISQNSVLDLPPLLMTAQASLAAGSRLAAYASALNTYNAIAAEMQAIFDDIDAATNPVELLEAINPVEPTITGDIVLDRDDLRLGSGFFSSLNGAEPEDMTLFFAQTSSTLLYDPEFGGFSSSESDVFSLSDSTVVLRHLGNPIATFNVASQVPTSFPFSA
jgi:hypothetical protein